MRDINKIAIWHGPDETLTWGIAPDGTPVTHATGVPEWATDTNLPTLIAGDANAATLTTPCKTVAQNPAPLLPTLCQSSPPDSMWAESVMVAGFIAQDERFDGVLLIPGKITRWVHISAQEVISFQSFLTGEIYDHYKVKGVAPDNATRFKTALTDTLSRPASLAAKLYQVAKQTPDNAQLLGLLIGAELAAAKPYWLGQNIAIIGAGTLSDAYATALRAQGLPVTTHAPADMALAGFNAAFSSLNNASHSG